VIGTGLWGERGSAFKIPMRRTTSALKLRRREGSIRRGGKTCARAQILRGGGIGPYRRILKEGRDRAENRINDLRKEKNCFAGKPGWGGGTV